MSTLRRHPLTGEFVLVAPSRGLRPNAFDRRRARSRTEPKDCPFCPGNEEETPPEVLRKVSGDRWTLRVVPNRYPAHEAHEVVIETRNHDEQFEELSPEHASTVIATYIERYRALARNPTLEFITIFKNSGDDSGQSIDHLHSQILGLPLIPPRAALLAGGFAGSTDCPLCRLLAENAELIIRKSGAFVLLVPAAAMFPYEQWILPTQHAPNFLATPSVHELARLMQQAVRAMSRALDGPSFNWIFQNSPIPEMPSFHWFVQLFPRLAQQGGFELGSGMQINIIEPAQAAAELRKRMDR